MRLERRRFFALRQVVSARQEVGWDFDGKVQGGCIFMLRTMRILEHIFTSEV